MSGSDAFMTGPIFRDAEIAALVDDAALLAQMLRVEGALARAQATLGMIPEASAERINIALENAQISDAALVEGVAKSGVPVPALVAALRTQLAPEDADWLHFGATSQDIVDTGYALCFRDALARLEARLSDLIDLLEAASQAHESTLMLARTRGQLATPITFGLRLAQWAQPLITLFNDLPALRARALRIQLGGASGSLSVLGADGPKLRTALADALNLRDAPPWHTVRRGQRDLSHWLFEIVVATAKIGRDFALASRGEIAEVRPGSAGGSSTMPHKANPVLAEALQSLLPIAAAQHTALAASAAHAEERDGALWPVEWMALPLLFEFAGAALRHAHRLLAEMQVDAARMAARIADMPEVKAEALVFALSAKLGRVEAARRVSAALAAGESLADLAAHSALPGAVEALEDSAFIAPAAETARLIFANRRTE